jgi:hypothetical protein
MGLDGYFLSDHAAFSSTVDDPPFGERSYAHWGGDGDVDSILDEQRRNFIAHLVWDKSQQENTICHFPNILFTAFLDSYDQRILSGQPLYIMNQCHCLLSYKKL